MSKLEVGDVFDMKVGDKTYASIQSKYVYRNASFDDDQYTHMDVTIGQVFEREKDAITGHKGLRLDTSHWVGEYVVETTVMEGGGGRFGDEYPDGWHVRARKLKDGKFDPEGQQIDFYQSGSFTVMRPDVPVKRRMQYTFVPAHTVWG